MPNKAQLSSSTPPDVVEYKIARAPNELHDAFELVFQSYHRAGLIPADHPSGMRLTPFHFADESEVLIARVRETVFSTLSLFGDGPMGVPMEEIYPEEVQTLRRRGRHIAEIGSLADRRSRQTRFLETLTSMGRLLGQTAKFHGYDTLVAAVHPKHARLYERVLGFERLGGRTQCPYANDKPAVALVLKLEDYVGTPFQKTFFGTPISMEQLRGYQWPESVKRYFYQLLPAHGQHVPSMEVPPRAESNPLSLVTQRETAAPSPMPIPTKG